MRRVLSILLSIVIFVSLPVSSYADLDIASLSDDELLDLANQVSIAIAERAKDKIADLPQVDTTSDSSDFSFDINLDDITTIEDLENHITEELGNNIDSLYSQWDTLKSETNTYKKYCDNSEKVSGFYQSIEDNTQQLCIMLKEYSVAYARMILDSNMSEKEKYDAADGLKESLYDDGCDIILDEIYNGILDEMNDYYYGKVLEKTPDDVDYSKWYNILSKEYEQWYGTTSAVYSVYYNTASDIYSFYYNLSSKLYTGDTERAEKLIERFLHKIMRDKGLNTEDQDTDISFDVSLRAVDSIEELENVVDAHIYDCVQALRGEWENLSTEIDTFAEYTDNIETIESFHTYIEDSASQLFAMICEYGIIYAELILQSDSSTKEKYSKFEDFKDCFYDEACSIVKDEIYDDLLGEIKEYYYEGVIKDSKNSVLYSKWSDTRGDAYSMWSNTRSDVYSSWSDTRSKLYSFYSDIRSKLYSGNIDGANRELTSFKKKVERMK